MKIACSPYQIDDSLTLFLMIAEETSTIFDAGSWLTPCYFICEDKEQEYKVKELLEIFNLKYNVQ